MAVNKDTGDTRTFTFDMFRLMPQPNAAGSWVHDTLAWDYGIASFTSIIEAELYDYTWEHAAGPQGASIDTDVYHIPGIAIYPHDADNFAESWNQQVIEIENTGDSTTTNEQFNNSA